MVYVMLNISYFIVVGMGVLFADDLREASTWITLAGAIASVLIAFFTARESRIATVAKLQFDAERAVEKEKLNTLTLKVKECDDEKLELKAKDSEQQKQIDALRNSGEIRQKQIDQLHDKMVDHERRCPK